MNFPRLVNSARGTCFNNGCLPSSGDVSSQKLPNMIICTHIDIIYQYFILADQNNILSY